MIPPRYRNVINPHQTAREIQSAVRFIDRMLAKLALTSSEEEELVGSNRPDRDWAKPG